MPNSEPADQFARASTFMPTDVPLPPIAPQMRGCIVAVCVVVFVCILFHFLIPIGPGGNDTSKAQLCEVNLHNLALAFAQYTEDNDGLYPRGIQTSANGVGWAGSIYPYAKTDVSFTCPSDVRSEMNGETAVSYGYNSNLAHKPGEIGLDQPGNTVLLFETSHCDVYLIPLPGNTTDEDQAAGASQFSAAGNGLDGFLLDCQSGSNTQTQYATGILGGRATQANGSQYDGAHGRHLGDSNYLMADGHIARLPGSRVSGGQSALTETDDQTGITTGFAAGSANPKFTATFSVR